MDVVQGKSEVQRHRYNGGARSKSWGQHYQWPIRSTELDLQEAQLAVSADKMDDSHRWQKNINSKLESMVRIL